jgi:methyl-accepting chemotaxis protein
MFETIDQQRNFADRFVVAALWLLAPVIAVAAALTGGAWLPLGVAAVGVATAATLMWRVAGGGLAVRLVTGVSLMAAVSLLVGAFAGHPWQIDMHMAYFAALAVLIIYCDWRTIVAATLVVALHHLVLSYVLPAAVFPGGGQIARVLIHAVILLAEAGVLIWAGHNISAMFEKSAKALEAAKAALERAEGANAEAESARSGEARAAREREAAQQATEAEARLVVGELAQALQRLAEGDMTHRIGARFPESYEQLKRDYNAAAEQLRSTLQSIVEVNGRVRSSIREISGASDDLSRRTEQQAATLEETAAALDGITATVRRTADGANHSCDLVAKAHDRAAHSGEVVRSAVEAMNSIEASSQQIGQIIGVIDEIAFQTNLLALNAGVEAARAGDAGKGFAVVAQEVRALAQRSAEAAKEIKALISTSAEQVDRGVALVGRTGEALDGIATQVGEINAVIAEIAQAATAEAGSLLEVNSAVGGLDQVTQQNAAMVEEATAATQALAGEVEKLSQLVARFRLSGAAEAVRAAA